MPSDRVQQPSWQPWSTAPRSGVPLIGLCNDGVTMLRVVWGPDLYGFKCWIGENGAYGDGLFRAWLPFPTEMPQ